MEHAKGFELGCGVLAALMAVVIKSWEIFTVSIILYVVLMVLNVATGTIQAHYNGTYCKDIANKAFYRKWVIILGVMAVVFVDITLLTFAKAGNIPYTIPYFSITVIAWQAVHELRSVIDNVRKVGGNMPGFVDKALDEVEKKIEDSVPIKGDDKDV